MPPTLGETQCRPLRWSASDLASRDLHCNQPFCELLGDHHLDFIMTCKPNSHEALYVEVALLDKLGLLPNSQIADGPAKSTNAGPIALLTASQCVEAAKRCTSTGVN